MSRIVTVAATQMACSWDLQANLEIAERLVREAAAKGAQIILIQELFEAPYFCQKPNPDYLQLATTVEENVAIKHFQKIAKELQVVLPISFYELAGRARFNSIAIIDADGSNLGIYRKSHIPDGPGYHEKYYFNPGDTGFKVWNTRYAKIGVGICWDQWFPEAARSMALQGAEILFWTHLAICRASTTVYAFQDGVLQFTAGGDNSPEAAHAITVGGALVADWGTNHGFVGVLDEFRITKGIARYTTDFTPPTAPFPNE